MRPDFTLKNYAAMWTEYGGTLASTILLALAIALLTTLLAFGFAYVIRFRAGRLGNALLFLTLITLFGGYLVKIYAWKSILGRDGILNLALSRSRADRRAALGADLQPVRHRHHAHLLPAALRRPADLQQHARDPAGHA